MFSPAVINGSSGDDGFYEQMGSPVAFGGFLRARYATSDGFRLGLVPSYEWIHGKTEDLSVRSLTLPMDAAGRIVRFDGSGLWVLGGLGYSRAEHFGQRAALGTTLVASGWTLRGGFEFWSRISSRLGAYLDVVARFDDGHFINGPSRLKGAEVFGGGLYLLVGMDLLL